jgi:hypothetical protein
VKVTVSNQICSVEKGLPGGWTQVGSRDRLSLLKVHVHTSHVGLDIIFTNQDDLLQWFTPHQS